VSMGLAIVFHEGSTLVVVGNALRLLNVRPTRTRNLERRKPFGVMANDGHG